MLLPQVNSSIEQMSLGGRLMLHYRCVLKRGAYLFRQHTQQCVTPPLHLQAWKVAWKHDPFRPLKFESEKIHSLSLPNLNSRFYPPQNFAEAELFIWKTIKKGKILYVCRLTHSDIRFWVVKSTKEAGLHLRRRKPVSDTVFVRNVRNLVSDT